jgi:hypothetical protein
MWFKVDDSVVQHPKMVAAGPAAIGLWTLAGAWSCAHLTDGFVPDQVLPRLCEDSEASASALLEAGLWHRDDERGGFVFHDWADYQPPSDAQRELRRKRAEAGRKGGLVSGQVRRRKAASVRRIESARGEANDEASAKAKRKQNGTPSPSPSSTSTDVEARAARGRAREASLDIPADWTELKKTPPPDTASSPIPREHSLPPDWTLTEADWAWAAAQVPTVDVRSATAKFIDYYRARPRVTVADWSAEWRRWMRREAEWCRRRGPDREPEQFANAADQTIARLLREARSDRDAPGEIA